MVNEYTGIFHIDCIQNKQGYMQYSSYESFSLKKDNENKKYFMVIQEP